jgi:hypothetical protein
VDVVHQKDRMGTLYSFLNPVIMLACILLLFNTSICFINMVLPVRLLCLF